LLENIDNKQETVNKIFRDTIVTILSEEYPFLAEVKKRTRFIKKNAYFVLKLGDIIQNTIIFISLINFRQTELDL